MKTQLLVEKLNSLNFELRFTYICFEVLDISVLFVSCPQMTDRNVRQYIEYYK